MTSNKGNEVKEHDLSQSNASLGLISVNGATNRNKCTATTLTWSLTDILMTRFASWPISTKDLKELKIDVMRWTVGRLHDEQFPCTLICITWDF